MADVNVIDKITIKDPTGGPDKNYPIGADASNVKYGENNNVANQLTNLINNKVDKHQTGGVDDRLMTKAEGDKLAEITGDPSNLVYLDNESGKIPSSVLPSYVDDVLEGYLNPADGKFYEHKSDVYNLVTPGGTENPAALGWYELNDNIYVLTQDTTVIVGKDYYVKTVNYTDEIEEEANKIYVELESNKTYRWSGSIFVEISESLTLGTTSSTAFPGNRGADCENNIYSLTTQMDGKLSESDLVDFTQAELQALWDAVVI